MCSDGRNITDLSHLPHLPCAPRSRTHGNFGAHDHPGAQSWPGSSYTASGSGWAGNTRAGSSGREAHGGHTVWFKEELLWTPNFNLDCCAVGHFKAGTSATGNYIKCIMLLVVWVLEETVWVLPTRPIYPSHHNSIAHFILCPIRYVQIDLSNEMWAAHAIVAAPMSPLRPRSHLMASLPKKSVSGYFSKSPFSSLWDAAFL